MALGSFCSSKFGLESASVIDNANLFSSPSIHTWYPCRWKFQGVHGAKLRRPRQTPKRHPRNSRAVLGIQDACLKHSRNTAQLRPGTGFWKKSGINQTTRKHTLVTPRCWRILFYWTGCAPAVRGKKVDLEWPSESSLCDLSLCSSRVLPRNPCCLEPLTCLTDGCCDT